MAGLLGDIYSYGNTLKRKVNGLLADPAGTAQQFVGQLGDDTNAQINNMLVGYGMFGNKSVLADPKQVQQARNALADYGAQTGIAGMFVGKGSKTWDAINAKKAEELAAKGVDPRKIWQETGTWKGPDGMWRQEIDDSAANLRSPNQLADLAGQYKQRQTDIKQLIKDSKSYPDLFPKELTQAQKYLRSESKGYEPALNEVFGLHGVGERGTKAKYAYDHKDFLNAYPDIGEEVVIRQGGVDGNYIGSYVKNQLDVNRAASSQPGGINSTTAHEFQHAIQGREGFAGGGNMQDETMRLISDAVENFEVSGLSRAEAIAKVNADAKRLNDLGRENYKRLAGEAEARATQARLPLNALQRRALFPEDSYDVPVNQLIIRGLLGQ